MPKNEEYMHHAPRKTEKKKIKSRNLSEDNDSRYTRITFKKYVQQVREQELLDDDDYDDLDEQL